MRLVDGSRVYVSGEVKYGETYYRVATYGVVVQDKGNGWVLVKLDCIDGDCNAVCMVRKKYIRQS